MKKQKLNEIGVLGVAGGVALGLLGTIALVKGFKVAKNIGGATLYVIANKLEAMKAAKEAAQELEDKKGILLPLIQKFDFYILRQ